MQILIDFLNQKFTYGFIMVFLVFLIKQFSRGAVCRIWRDLTNQVIIITGANCGIGYETAQRLGLMNAIIILACRDVERGQNSAKKLRAETQNNNIEFIKLDLADLNSIDKFCEIFKKKYKSLDILINNAGVMLPKSRLETQDGFQIQIGTNHIGHYYLTNILLELLIKTPNSRIINVSSRAHKRAGQIDWSNYNSQKSYSPLNGYIYSQLSNVYHSMLMQETFDSQALRSQAVSLHPGVVRTQLWRFLLENKVIQYFAYILYPLIIIFTKNCVQGAQTTLYCALVNYSELVGGQYYAECQIASRKPFAQDLQQALKLQILTKEMIERANKKKQ